MRALSWRPVRPRAAIFWLALILCLPAAGRAASGAPGAGVPSREPAIAASALAPSGGAQEVETLRLSSAPVSLVAPADRGQWARRLAGFADAATQTFAGILGAPPPPGTIRWTPDPAAATNTSADISIDRDPSGVVLGFNDPFAILAEDYGVAFAQGYARWVTAYAIARLYFSAADDPSAWWIDGAALYMTELLSRRERATTPVLYNLEAAYNRAARMDDPVPLTGPERLAAGDAARGKALATFRLLESLYGEAAVANLLVMAVNSPAAADIRETAVGNLPADLEPDPGELLDAWLDPRAKIDLALEDVRIGGGRISGKVLRQGAVPVWTQVEVRLASGQLLYADIPAGTVEAEWELEFDEQPVGVRLDPDGLLPDINRSNNRYGFGDADRVRAFFPLDNRIEIGELHFGGEIEQVGRKRVEDFSVTLRNLGSEPLGLGLLVSAQWIDRPASRTQRRIFVMLPPGELLVARDFVEYPRRGTGPARIEARYWQADDPDVLTERLLRDPADLLNSYLITRNPAQATGSDASPMERLQAEQAIESIASLAVAGGTGTGATSAEQADADSSSSDSPQNSTVEQPTAEPVAAFGVRIISPTETATPLGEMTFAATVDGPPPALWELYVNDEIIGRGDGSTARATFDAAEEESVFVLRALAVGADGRIATDTRVLSRGAIGFGASVDVVTLNVTVHQPGGGFVEDLTLDDFSVVEDGVVQTLESFSKGEDTAVSAAMLLDNSSSMIGGGITSARAGANRLIDTLLRGNDRAMVLGFNDRVYLHADFTNDVAELRQAIDTTRPDGATALYDAIVESLRKVNRRTGRRALIVLSDGLDVESVFGFEDVLEYTRQSDVLVYTIGLQLMHDATELSDASDVVRQSVENLRSLAEATGGSAYFPLRLDELEGVYAEIAAELESQYSLSYTPTNQAWDGQWRTLEVSLKSRAGNVQARPGYYGVRPGEGR